MTAILEAEELVDCQRVIVYKSQVFVGERGEYRPMADEPGEYNLDIFNGMSDVLSADYGYSYSIVRALNDLA